MPKKQEDDKYRERRDSGGRPGPGRPARLPPGNHFGGADGPPKFLFFTVKNEELTLSKGPQGIKKVY